MGHNNVLQHYRLEGKMLGGKGPGVLARTSSIPGGQEGQEYPGLDHNSGQQDHSSDCLHVLTETSKCWSDPREGQLEHKSHKEELREVEVFSWEKRRLGGTLLLSTVT